eukprot:COSAG02_NODE_152_length_33208_cov_13.316591_5_plen_106_part_00
MQLPQPSQGYSTYCLPTVTESTPAPRPMTVPPISCESASGDISPPAFFAAASRRNIPSSMCRSEWHSPATSTRSSTSPGPCIVAVYVSIDREAQPEHVHIVGGWM